MMVVPMTRLVALSLPIGLWDWTGAGVLVITGDSTTLDGGMTKVGVSEMVAFAELGGVTVALVETGAEVGTGSSEAGILVGAIDVGSTVGPEETPDPVGTPDGEMPDTVGLSLTEGTVTPELVGITSVSLGIGGVIPTLGVTVGVGTSPDAVGTPVGKIPEENSDTILWIMLLAGGRGADPVAVGVSNRLVKMLGKTDAAGSGMIVGRRLDTSEIKEDTAGGTIPDGSGTGEGETGAVGPAVGPAEPVGDTPATSDTNDDRIDGRLRGSEGRTASEVGMAPVGDAPVPNAVVMPTTIPPEDAAIGAGLLAGITGAGVGCTGSLGRTPVEPTWVGVGSGSLRRVESKPPTKP